MTQEEIPSAPWVYFDDGSSTWSVGGQDDPQEKSNVCTIFDHNDSRALAKARLLVTVPELVEASADAHEAIAEACYFLRNGTSIHNGSELHADLAAARDRLAAVLVKGGYAHEQAQ
jgi:hypothetical protein